MGPDRRARDHRAMHDTIAPSHRAPEPDEVAVIQELGRAEGWQASARTLLADLGFSLIDSDRPAAVGSHLLVAFRGTPTLRHYDPEQVGFYAPAEARSAFALLEGSKLAGDPRTRTVLWGHVHLVDRLAVENRFLTFGGDLRIAVDGPDLTIADLASPAPIVRWGGHSQGADALAGEIGEFFGRLIARVDFDADARVLLASVAPADLYAAFLADAGRRLDPILSRGAIDAFGTWLIGERHRVREQHAATWNSGLDLLRRVGLGAAA